MTDSRRRSNRETESAIDAITRRRLEVPKPGTLIDDHFLVEEQIGAGGMGAVFRARDLRLQRAVAIKLVHAEVAADAELRSMFQREAQIMANLRHPNVVGVHDSGRWEGRPYLVMPFLEGMSLAMWASRRSGPPISADVAVGLVGQACAGASALHAAGVVHGDIKPQNVLVSEALEAVLVDLGSSQHTNMVALAGEVSGTPGFIAPELIEDTIIDPAQASKIDTYALGVTAYWLLVGQLPWPSGGSRLELLSQQLHAPLLLPSVARPELGTSFDEPLRAALQRDPALRPTAAELRAQLVEACALDARRQRFIVIVDDDVDMLELMEAVAATAVPDAEIVGVRDSRAAMSIIESRPPDLVVTDLQMPRINGLELVAMMRGSPSTAETPVVVVSAVGGADEWRMLHALGAECLVHKPLKPEYLRMVIEHSVEAPGS